MDLASLDAHWTERNGRLGAKGLRTKESLLAAARSAFEGLGYVETRISDVVHLAGVGQATFYTYWASKDDAFSELVVGLHDDVRGPGAGTGRHEPRQSIRTSTERYVSAYRANARLMAAWEQAAACNPSFHELKMSFRAEAVRRVSRFIAELQRSGLSDAHLDATCAAKALVSMTNHRVYVAFALGQEEEDVQDMADDLYDMWIRSIGLVHSKPIQGKERHE